MKEGINRQILLVEKPSGKLGSTIFASSKARFQSRATARSFCACATFHWTQPIASGCTEQLIERREPHVVMAGGSVAEVIELKAPGFATGDPVFSDTG